MPSLLWRYSASRIYCKGDTWSYWLGPYGKLYWVLRVCLKSNIAGADVSCILSLPQSISSCSEVARGGLRAARATLLWTCPKCLVHITPSACYTKLNQSWNTVPSWVVSCTSGLCGFQILWVLEVCASALWKTADAFYTVKIFCWCCWDFL